MTTPLFLLRCLEVGLTMSDLDLVSIGLVLDMWTEKGKDSLHYDTLATQDDMDRF